MSDNRDLFSDLADSTVAARAPLAARMRPRSLDEVVGQSHLVAPGRPLRRLIESDRMASIILWGPPGTGKTTLAELIATTTQRRFERVSAVNSGVKDIRDVIERARTAVTVSGESTVVFVDEIHRFNTTQQDALLHAVESGLLTLVGATTENPAFSVNPALRSRSSVFALEPVTQRDVEVVLQRAIDHEQRRIDPDALSLIARRATGDVRQALTALEVAMTIAGTEMVTVDDAAAALTVGVARLSDDDHYDLASALIKSMRASETDVALHWLARLIEAGEDPRFIARRLMIFASEDIGMADPQSLLIATAAAQSVALVGLPEARLTLAHAVIHLSVSAKSRAVTDALDAAMADVREGKTGRAPRTTEEPPRWRPLGFEVPRYYRG